MHPPQKQNTPRGLTPDTFVDRIAKGDDAKAILDDYGVGYSLVARWRKNNKWFADAYPAAVVKAGKRLSQGQFDALYPGWKTIFISILGDMAERTERPTKSAALITMNEMGIPLNSGRLYACTTPGSRYYDEDFSMEVETYGSADFINELFETFSETLLEQVKEGKDLSTALAYMKAHPLSPLKDRQDIRISKREETIKKRLEVRATIVSDSRSLGDKITKEITDGLSEERGSTADVRVLEAEFRPREEGDGEDGEEEGRQEESHEEEVGQEVASRV